MTVGLDHYLILAGVLFGVGLMGVLTRKNLLIIFMSIEVMLNAANLVLIALARFRGLMDGHVVAFFVMTIAAAEAAVGLGILISVFRNRKTVNVDDLRIMSG